MSGLEAALCCCMEEPMFESLTRIRAALARASRHRKTVRALNALPTEIQKDIGWTESKAIDEIRLPF